MLIHLVKIIAFMILFLVSVKIADYIYQKFSKRYWVMIAYFVSVILPGLIINPLPKLAQFIVISVGASFVIILFELSRKKIENMKIKF